MWADSVPNLVIGVREGLEIGLVVSILLAALRRIAPDSSAAPVWADGGPAGGGGRGDRRVARAVLAALPQHHQARPRGLLLPQRPTEEGEIYCAAVMDAYSRLIIGWSIATRMRTELVTDALGMAIMRRKPKDNTTIIHSDHGSQPEFNW